jgi:hypothetical protein
VEGVRLAVGALFVLSVDRGWWRDGAGGRPRMAVQQANAERCLFNETCLN